MFINGLKYACSTCIKGHRSSHCSHVDRPLFEIRKKGRPVTQCTFCRDLRKTKQVHIKCACSGDKKASSASSTPTSITNATTTSSITNAEGQPILIHRNNSITSNHSNSSSSKCNVDDPCQDKSKKSTQCTCPHTSNNPPQQGQKASSIIAKQSPTTSTTGATPSYFPQVNVTQDTCTQMDVSQDSNLSLLAPLCNTPPPPSQPVKEENLSYSWALITSPSSNQIELPSTSAALASNHNSSFFSDMLVDSNSNNNNNNNDSNNLQHLGFIFHKPTSTQRFLDGQPRVRRRRSTNQKRINAANSTSVTPTNYNNGSNRLPVNALMDAVLTIDTLGQDYNLSTPPSSAVSPHQISSSASSAAMEPMDMQFDYLTEQLEILSSSNNNSNNNDTTTGYMGDLANADELTAILNNVLQKEEDDLSLPSSSSYAGSIVDPNQSPTTAALPSNTALAGSNPLTPTTTAVAASKRKSSGSSSHPLSPMNRSQCGSFVPRSKCCKPAGAVGGESVVITITPLTNTTNDEKSMMTMMLEDDHTQQKTTTRIVTCYCGSQCTCPGCLVHPGNFFLGSDPYAGLMMNPSSSASSSCYGSDEEDMSSMYGRNENFMSF